MKIEAWHAMWWSVRSLWLTLLHFQFTHVVVISVRWWWLMDKQAEILKTTRPLHIQQHFHISSSAVVWFVSCLSMICTTYSPSIIVVTTTSVWSINIWIFFRSIEFTSKSHWDRYLFFSIYENECAARWCGPSSKLFIFITLYDTKSTHKSTKKPLWLINYWLSDTGIWIFIAHDQLMFGFGQQSGQSGPLDIWINFDTFWPLIELFNHFSIRWCLYFGFSAFFSSNLKYLFRPFSN